MKCPYCAKEAEKGLIRSPQEISWLAGKKPPVFGNSKFHKDSVVLSKLSILKGSAVEAYLCRSCKKVIIDYADSKADYNRK